MQNRLGLCVGVSPITLCYREKSDLVEVAGHLGGNTTKIMLKIEHPQIRKSFPKIGFSCFLTYTNS